ncbi:MAG: Hpt domain-containing protein [Anaerobutyricum sp.]|nr:Hpt domain-containing protein [Anaerobutyricum sp.]
MTIEECYEKIGGNYEEVLGRMMRPALVRKFIMKFPADDSFAELCEQMKAGNRKEAFRAAHTLKGVCQNLGLGRLSFAAEKITEILRPETEEIPKEAYTVFETVKREYEETVAVINGIE